MRSHLPNRRPHEAFHFSHWGRRFIAGIGRAYPNGPVMEVWLNSGRTGEQAETLARDSAVLISLGLQYGVPLEAMRKAVMRDMDGEASGPIGKLVDILAREGDQGSAGLPDNAGPTDPSRTDNGGALAPI